MADAPAAVKQEKPTRKRPASALKSGKGSKAAAAGGGGGGGGGGAATAPAPAPAKRKSLDTTRQGVKVWLVKVPVAVAEALKAAQEGEKIGSLTVSRTTGGSSSSSAAAGGGGGGGGARAPPAQEHRTESVCLEEAFCEPLELPREYTLEAPPPDAKMPRMYALRADDSGKGRMMVEGLINRRTSLLPTASADYRLFAKKRQIQHHRKERRLEIIKDDRGPDARGGGARSKVIDLNAPIGPVDGEGGGGGSGAGPERKRLKLDPKALQTEIFRLFDDKPNWTTKELAQRLGQGNEAIKNVLKDIAEYHTSGDLRGSYTLRKDLVIATSSMPS